jgi:hypothetical protein
MLRFRSPHPPGECVRLLKELVAFSIFGFAVKKPFVGRVSEKNFLITEKGRYGNSFKPWLRGKLAPFGSGTEIEANIGMHPFAKVFLFLWFGALAVIGSGLVCAGLYQIVGEEDWGVEQAMLLIIPLGMAAFGVALVKIGRHLAGDEPVELKSFLCKTLDAKEVDTANDAVG